LISRKPCHDPSLARPAEFRAFLKDEYQRWGAIVKASDAKVD
jgi:tripartite-type tricarboxylate transporter receptor subunit TctC